jgi:hypothetical protein
MRLQQPAAMSPQQMRKENGYRPIFAFDNASFIYDPYPIGISTNVLPEDYYSRLIEEWPPTDLFMFKEELGKKYSLSQVNNPDGYHEFIKASPSWQQFYRYIKSPEFVYEVIELFHCHNINLGLPRIRVDHIHHLSNWKEHLKETLRRLKRFGTQGTTLSARFEFSMLPANKGCIKPHTDAPQKIITLVLSIVRAVEWDPAFDGGTVVLRPTDISQNYNYINKQLEFHEVETVTSFPFQPNQCVLFVKTFNSLHAVHPMTGENSDAMRKTITINIERCE